MTKHIPPQWQQVPPFQDHEQARRGNVVTSPTGMRQRVPKLPFMYFLDNSGNLIRLAVGSTRNAKGAVEAGGDPNRVINFNRNRAIREGMVPWEYGDANRYASWLVGTKTQAEWEAWREEELQRRRTDHNSRSANYSRAWESDEKRRADILVEAINRSVDSKMGKKSKE